jgi:hypothetical protein
MCAHFYRNFYISYKYTKMGKYNCTPCSFDTDRLFDFNRHNKSKKHLEKCKKPIIINNELAKVSIKLASTQVISEQEICDGNKCPDCGNIFVHKSSLSRHRKTCSKEVVSDVVKEKDKKIQELEATIIKMELEKYKEKCTLLEKNVKILSANNKTLSTVAESNAETSKTSCSALNFVMRNYKNAPCIQEFNEYQLLLEGNEDHTIADVVLHKFKNKELVSFIGDVLIKKYKTDNPEDRSMWTSDTARLAYMIRELTGGEPEWLQDKGGVKTANYTVKPILKHIKDDLNRLIKENRKALLDTDRDDLISDKATELRNNIINAQEILQIIAKNQLTNDVIKYIASHFFLDRKLDQKTLTFEDEEGIIGD